MRPTWLLVATALSLVAPAALAVHSSADGPYKVLKIEKVGGDGGFDYVYADTAGRKLYAPRSGPNARITVFNLDTLAPVAELPKINAHGAVVDSKSHHGFCSSSPVGMWDSKTFALIKTIDVKGRPDGILGDPASQRVYILSHEEPNITVIDARSGDVLGAINVGGEPEQSVVDGKGHMFVDLENKDAVAVVDTKSLKLIATYSLDGQGGGNAGLAFDIKNHVLFVACREPKVMVMMNSNTGKILGTLPIGDHCDGAVFNPRTKEVFASQGDGMMTIIKETSPTTFVVEQTLKTMSGAKTMTLDWKTNKMFLIGAEYLTTVTNPTATTTPGARPRRVPFAPGSFSIVEVGK